MIVANRKCMQRMQFYIEPAIRSKLDAMASVRGVPVAELIREAIASFVAREQPVITGDPILRLAGVVNSPDIPSDIAENHDRYIYIDDWSNQ